MTNKTLIPKVAKAMEECRFKFISFPLVRLWPQLAEAAIEAMKEPTNEMENSGTRVLALDWVLCADGRIAGEVWSAMVDSALSGKLTAKEEKS